jgi:hypothetical protein
MNYACGKVKIEYVLMTSRANANAITATRPNDLKALAERGQKQHRS